MAASISIITASYNAVSTIQDCIESVHKQDIPVEHIIIDGCSDDGTLKIIENQNEIISTIVSEKDEGIYDAVNKGIKLATGDIIGLLHADDVYADLKILSKITEVFSDENVESCYGDLVYVDPKDTGKVTRNWKAGTYNNRRFYYGWMPPHPTFFVRRSIYEKYGDFNSKLGTSADYELMLRFLLRHNITTRYIPEVLVKMRTGGVSNVSLKNRLIANRNDRLAWKVNGLKPYPFTLILKPIIKIRQVHILKKTPNDSRKLNWLLRFIMRR